ncbi:MAG TPA: hypothetical protein VFM37_15235 [Pseudonocardiaceae bacterium]|nr:hypothetical protein [Pseudonocardiaceae bacterium]
MVLTAGVAAAVAPAAGHGSGSVRQEHGIAVCRADRAGYCTVAHPLGVRPTDVRVTPRNPGAGLGYRLSVVAGSAPARR